MFELAGAERAVNDRPMSHNLSSGNSARKGPLLLDPCLVLSPNLALARFYAVVSRGLLHI
jgi:hypothetical protein